LGFIWNLDIGAWNLPFGAAVGANPTAHRQNPHLPVVSAAHSKIGMPPMEL